MQPIASISTDPLILGVTYKAFDRVLFWLSMIVFLFFFREIFLEWQLKYWSCVRVCVRVCVVDVNLKNLHSYSSDENKRNQFA